jgi:superfamily I DNA/RNA helicase
VWCRLPNPGNRVYKDRESVPNGLYAHAKGLQFKDVFIPGCDKNTDKRAALYVAMTRFSERLYLGYTSRLSSLFPSYTDSVYNNNDDIEII